MTHPGFYLFLKICFYLLLHMVSVPLQFCCLKYPYIFVFTQLQDLKTVFFNAKLYSPTRGHQSNRLHCNPNCIEIDNQMLIKNNTVQSLT